MENFQKKTIGENRVAFCYVAIYIQLEVLSQTSAATDFKLDLFGGVVFFLISNAILMSSRSM